MNIWFKLAWKEFWLPFLYWKSEGGCPGGRDFVWLTTMLALVLTLCLLLLGSSEGLLNRFVDVLLGKIPGHGVPVWVTTNIFREDGMIQINDEIMSDINKVGFSIHPYREVESNDIYLGLPGNEALIWKKPDKDSPDFTGWTVYKNDPLWDKPSSAHNLPLEILINKTLFNKYFNYNAYRKGLKDYLPEKLWKKLPEKTGMNNFEALEEFWMRLNNDLVPLKIIWTDRIPTVKKLAFLFPMTTYHALSFAHRYPELRYFPESFGAGGTRIKQISIEGDNDNQKIRDLVTNLGGEWSTSRGDTLLTFFNFLPSSWIESYAEYYNVDFQIMESVSGDTMKEENGKFSIPCSRLPERDMKEKDIISCNSSKKYAVKMDVATGGNGFTRAIVYVPDRTLLFEAREKLIEVKERALSIHPLYQDALNRFGFLSRMIEVMRKPYSVILILSLVSLLGIQIFTLVGHRRHRYGMFLSKGIIWWQIYFMLFLQIIISIVLGAAVTFLTITTARIYLQYAIKSVAADYKETLNIADLNLLPLSYNDYISVTLLILLMTWALAAIVLYFMPLRRRTHPATLFQE